MCAIKNENYGVHEKYLKSQFYLVFFLKNDVFSIQPCTVWEDDIYDKCLHVYTIRKLPDFQTECNIEILCLICL